MTQLLDGLKYSLGKIEPVSHSINVPEEFEYSKKLHKMSSIMNVKIDIDSDLSDVTFEVDFRLIYSDRNIPDSKEEFFRLKSRSVFNVENIEKYSTTNSDDMNEVEDDFIKYFLDITLSHARGMQSVILKNTSIARFHIPQPQPGHTFDTLDEKEGQVS